jgi:multidrug efflux system membrane fusion protein
MKRLFLLLALVGCSPGVEVPKSAPKPPVRKAKVTIAAAVECDIVSAVQAAGSIEASEEISIPAQVTGVLDSVAFKEGDVVDVSKVLAEIDLERFALAVTRATAELDRAKAQAELAETLYTNRLKLYEEGKKREKEWLTEEQMAQWRADLAKAKADVSRVTADLDLAKRDLKRASVRSPIAGIINRKLVS